MKSLKYSGKRVGFKTNGRGKKAIVFLHGFCEDSCIWDDFKKDLLTEKERVIAIDFPGFGKSEVVENLSIDYMADVVHAVMEDQKLEKIILIGHSMG
ncbi:MAG TPA: alpha/beta hydrolase, partial [Saprospiraceae bacterium]|nr:alpha/beta hydrolase [Saprospiraceae bacterium]